MKIAILGYGNFGSGFGSYLESIGNEIIKNEVDNANIVLVAVPSFVVIKTLVDIKEKLVNKKIIICSKGFTCDGNLIGDELKENGIDNIFFLYGPTLIDGINKGELSAAVLAGGNGKEEIKKYFESERFHIELSEDTIGVSVGAALKNVMTMFMGVVIGAGYGENTKGFIFTRCLQEIQKFGVVLGADKDTFYGLSCLGDLMLNSRNRNIGIEFGKGKKIDDIVKESDCFLEGLGTLKNARIMASKHKIDTPIIDLLYGILFEDASIDESIKKIK